MERIEKILRWSWASVPVFFAGWVLLLIQAVGVFVAGFLLVRLGREWFYEDNKLVALPITAWIAAISCFFIQPFLWMSWAFDGYQPLFFDFLKEFTVLHWVGLL